jgi:hypothetical protein
MTKITVFHPANSHINGGSTVFSGDLIEHSTLETGELVIRNWRTHTEQGHAIFARGEWAYVCESRPRKEMS